MDPKMMSYLKQLLHRSRARKSGYISKESVIGEEDDFCHQYSRIVAATAKMTLEEEEASCNHHILDEIDAIEVGRTYPQDEERVVVEGWWKVRGNLLIARATSAKKHSLSQKAAPISPCQVR